MDAADGWMDGWIPGMDGWMDGWMRDKKLSSATVTHCFGVMQNKMQVCLHYQLSTPISSKGVETPMRFQATSVRTDHPKDRFVGFYEIIRHLSREDGNFRLPPVTR